MRNLNELAMYDPFYTDTHLSLDIEEYEKFYSVSLPSTYISFLQYSNGGYSELCYIEPRGTKPGDGYVIDSFFGLYVQDKLEMGNLWEETKIVRANLGTNALPFGLDAGGNPFYIDLNQGGKVFIAHHDPENVTFLAESFEDFIDMLQLDPNAL